MSKHVCSCPWGYRSSHCDFHGSCLCAYGATCPTHDEPVKLTSIPTFLAVEHGGWNAGDQIAGQLLGAQAWVKSVVSKNFLELGPGGRGNFIPGESIHGPNGTDIVRRFNLLELMALAANE